MLRMLKSATPLVALAFLLSVTTVARAQDAAADPQAGKGTISGTVTDKDGNPAPAVNVRVFHPFERGQRGTGGGKAQQQNAAPAQDEKQDKPAKGDKPRKGDRPKPVATTSTDKDGHFQIADLPAGKYVVMAMVRGAGSARQEVEVTAGGDAKVQLKLKERAAKGEKKGQKKDEPAAE